MSFRGWSGKFRPLAGFTLIEMLVSLAIFSVITGFVVANFNSGRQSDELRIAAQLMASVLRRAQTYAQSGQTVAYCSIGKKMCPNGQAQCDSGDVCITDVPPGYGVHLTTDAAGSRQAVFFADLNGDRRYQAVEALRSDSISPGVQVYVSALTATGPVGALDIVFWPPKPTVYFNDTDSAAVAAVRLANRQNSQTRDITVNRVSGQINAD